MNLTSPSDVRSLLEEIDVRPNKVLGQNFMIDRNILNILIKAADLSPDDHVLEVGGGLGVVTEELALKAGRVTVVEKDKRLAAHLTKKFHDQDHVEVICADAVDVLSETKQWKGSGSRPTVDHFDKVVANLPYSVGTKLLVDQIKSVNRPKTIVVTVQLEVADRFVAACGKKEYGILSVWSHMHYDVELVKSIRGTCFWPRPEVSSGILKFEAHDGLQMTAEDETFLYAFTKYVFGQRRKQMAGILGRASEAFRVEPDRAKKIFEDLGIELSSRPQTLSVSDWARLSVAVREDR